MSRLKLYVEYPLAKTLNEAIEFMKKGGAVWQEDSSDFPGCGGFDDVQCLRDNFSERDWDYDEENQDLHLHLVPEGQEESEAEPFVVGERVWAMEGHVIDVDNYINKGESYKITKIRDDLQYLALDKYEDRWFPYDMFCRCILPIYTTKVYILADMTNIHGLGYDIDSTYYNLEFLKSECEDVLWSDEYEDFEEELGRLGISGQYLGSNWDIEGINKETAKLVYGVGISELRRQGS